MRAIVSDLQRAVFQISDERLVAVANIVRIDNKKRRKPTFLCLTEMRRTITTRKKQFTLRDVKTVDGINPRKLIPEFELVVEDRLFRLCASTTEEKDSFIKQLYKFANKYLPVQKPDFVNVPLPVETPHTAIIAERIDDDTDEGLVDYQPISVKEEADFRRLLARASLTIGEADKFATVLASQLQLLDGANIQSIMDSETAVNDLILLVEDALKEADFLDKELDNFDELLYVNSLGCVERKNTRILKDFLLELVTTVDIVSEDHIRALHNANLSDPVSISRCCAAARALQAYSSAKVNPSMHLMVAYKERTEQLNQLTDRFIEKLMAHMSALFSNLNDLIEISDWNEIAIRKQSERFHALRPFSDLMGWLKLVRLGAYHTLIQRYVQNTKLVYMKEFERFFESINGELHRIINFERKSTLRGSDIPKSTAEKFLFTECKVDSKEVIRLIEVVLGEVGPVVESEQKFCTRFFHMAGDLLAALETQSTSSGDSGLTGKNIEKQITDQVRAILSPLFESLHDHFDKFIKSCCRLQPPYVFPIYELYVALSLQDASSYFSVMVFGRLVVLVKRQMDAYLNSKSYQLAEVKISKRVRIGILESVYQFAELAHTAETAFSGTERRADLDRWYVQLITSLKDGIEYAATSPFSKSPAAVVRFENYHRLYSVLSELKIDCLDLQRKEAKKAYQDNIQIYVRELMGRPLEKYMLHFFESIENAIRQGVKPEEIAFHQQFSRLELKKAKLWISADCSGEPVGYIILELMGCGVEPRVELALRRTLFFGLILFVYLVFGASIFSALPKRQQILLLKNGLAPGSHEAKCEKSAARLDAQRNEMLNVLWAGTMAKSEHEWFLMANQKLDIYERLVLNSCRRVANSPSKSFNRAFMHAFTLVTTIGFLDEENFSPIGKITAMSYAIIGIPLALLYLAQCSKMFTGLFPGNYLLIAALVALFAAAVIFDIVEDSNDDTPFIDVVFHIFLILSTVGSCNIEPSIIVVLVALFAASLISMSYALIDRHIEHALQKFELQFSKYFGILRRWICSKDEFEENKIFEEEEETESDT
ncbi:Exocyst complex component 1 [Dirofilaria immitis]|nr:Exocyst complex component 1 [Dirofilaria immitis]